MAETDRLPAFTTRHLDGDRRFLVICDHARNCIPPQFDNLGLPAAQLDTHIAYDPGALQVAEIIADTLGCPLIASQFSRLLIDPNRGLDDPTLVMKLSDGAVIPGNRHVDRDAGMRALQQRIDTYYAPYHAAIAAAIEAALAENIAPIILSVHSFTPVWRGTPRPWQAAILWDKDDRLPALMKRYMAAQPDIIFGDNEPYCGQLKHDCLYRHATQNGLPHGLIELRQDEIAHPEGQAHWAAHMCAILNQAVAEKGMNTQRFFGSVTD